MTSKFWLCTPGKTQPARHAYQESSAGPKEGWRLKVNSFTLQHVSSLMPRTHARCQHEKLRFNHCVPFVRAPQPLRAVLFLSSAPRLSCWLECLYAGPEPVVLLFAARPSRLGGGVSWQQICSLLQRVRGLSGNCLAQSL